MRLVDDKFVMNIKLDDIQKGVQQGTPIDAFIPYPQFYYEMSNLIFNGGTNKLESVKISTDALLKCPIFFEGLLEYHTSMGGTEDSLQKVQYFKEWSSEEILESYLTKVSKYVTSEYKHGVNDALYDYMEVTLARLQGELGKDRFDEIVQAKGLTKQIRWIGINLSKVELGIWSIKNFKSIWNDIRSKDK